MEIAHAQMRRVGHPPSGFAVRRAGPGRCARRPAIVMLSEAKHPVRGEVRWGDVAAGSFPTNGRRDSLRSSPGAALRMTGWVGRRVGTKPTVRKALTVATKTDDLVGAALKPAPTIGAAGRRDR
jgi:hypothetical protein